MLNGTCNALRLTDTEAVKETQLCTGQYEECLPSTTVSVDNIGNLISVESAKYAATTSIEEAISNENLAAINETTPDLDESIEPIAVEAIEEEVSPETVYVPQVVYVQTETSTPETQVVVSTEEEGIESIPSVYQSEDLGIFGWNQSEGVDLLISSSPLEESLVMNDYGGGNLYKQLLTNQTTQKKTESTGTDWSFFYWGLIGVAAYVYTLFVVKSMLCPYYKAKVEMDRRKKSGSKQ